MINPLLSISPTSRRDLVLTSRTGSPTPERTDTIYYSIDSISRMLQISYKEVTRILNSTSTDHSMLETIPKPKAIRLSEDQIDNIVSPEVMTSHMKYSLCRRLLLIRSMYPDVKITPY